MLKNDKTKLELIRLEGIRNLIIKKIPKIELNNIVKQELKIESKDCYDTLKTLKRYQLIKIIENCSNINSDDIDNYYEQFRYGLKPGFTIFNFLKSEIKGIEIDKATSFINEKLDAITYLEDAKFKNLSLKDILEIKESTFEFSFVYLSKYTYIAETDEPDFIYELKDCFVWINFENNFIAIKNCPSDIQNKLLDIFSTLLNTSFYNIKMTRKLISAVFNGNIKKGTFVKPNAGDDEVKKITISDEKLSTKKIYKDDVSSYDVSSTFLDEQLDDNTKSTLGINCKAGKVYLTRNVNATQFRNWSIDSLNKITNYLNNIQNCKESDIFESRNILANSKYSNDVKQIIENICYSIFLNICTGETSFLLKENIVNIFNKLKNRFYVNFFGFCDACNEETQLFCSKCNDSNLKFIGNNILCLNCEENIKNFLCDEGHNIYISDISKILRLMPKNEFMDEINQLLFTNFGFRLDGTFTIEDNHLNIHKYSSGQVLEYSKVLEFQQISKIDLPNIENAVIKFDKIKEKCKKCSNETCPYCEKTNDLCIMKLFVGFGDYRPSPHHGQEFGDVNFKITYGTGEVYNFVGIAKSRPKSNILNLSSSESREMLQQILSMSRDKRVDVIGAICPARFHDQLVQELHYLAKITNVKILILDDVFMSKLLIHKNIV